MKRIRRNRPRCRYVYFCALQDASPEQVESRRCLLPAGHLVGLQAKKPWKHQHVAYFGGHYVEFDHNCDCLLEDVQRDWAETHPEVPA